MPATLGTQPCQGTHLHPAAPTWNQTSTPGSCEICATYCRGFGFTTDSWQSLSSCSVSSAMRPLEGMPSRMVSRAASCRGFWTAGLWTRGRGKEEREEGGRGREWGGDAGWRCAAGGRVGGRAGVPMAQPSMERAASQRHVFVHFRHSRGALAVLFKLHATSIPLLLRRCRGAAAAWLHLLIAALLLSLLAAATAGACSLEPRWDVNASMPARPE